MPRSQTEFSWINWIQSLRLPLPPITYNIPLLQVMVGSVHFFVTDFWSGLDPISRLLAVRFTWFQAQYTSGTPVFYHLPVSDWVRRRPTGHSKAPQQVLCKSESGQTQTLTFCMGRKWPIFLCMGTLRTWISLLAQNFTPRRIDNSIEHRNSYKRYF